MKKVLFTLIILKHFLIFTQDTTCLGVGYGGHYNGEQFINYINDLVITHTFITINWDWYEPIAGQYQDSIILSFLELPFVYLS